MAYEKNIIKRWYLQIKETPIKNIIPHIIKDNNYVVHFGLETPWIGKYIFKIKAKPEDIKQNNYHYGPRRGFFRRIVLDATFHCVYCCIGIFIMRIFIKPFYDLYCLINNIDPYHYLTFGKQPRSPRLIKIGNKYIQIGI